MKLPFLPLLLLALTLRAEPPGIEQSSELLNVPAGDKFLRWYGHAGRSYFLQVSDPTDHLGKWNWAPIIEGGNDEEISYEVDGTAAKGFFRLKFTDQVHGPEETLETADFDNDGRSNFDEISPPPLSGVTATDPLDDDTDDDGLLDGFELAYGFDPNNPDEDENNVLDGEDDRDDDGWSNADEADAGTNPNDPNDNPDTPAEPWLVVTGNAAEDVPVTKTRTFTIKKGQSRILVIGTTSEEYPDFTGEASEWNDLLEWNITPSSGDAINGSLNVNDRHEDWVIDEINGVALHGFGSSPPVHIETVKMIQAPANRDVTVTVKLTATNISDDILPSTVIVGLLPVELEIKRGGLGINPPPPAAANTPVAPTWQSQGGAVRDLVSIWSAHTSSTQVADLKGDWMQARVQLGGLAANNLPANFVVWLIDGLPAPAPNTLETPRLSWPAAGVVEKVQVTVGGKILKVYVDVPDVGGLNHVGWVAMMAAVHGNLIGAAGVALAYNYGTNETAWSDAYTGKLSVKNALRHSSWIAHCASQSQINPLMALFLGLAHENDNFSSGNNWAYESTMDLHNNAIGDTCVHSTFFGNPDTAAIHNDVTAKLTAGLLWIWDSPGPEHTGFKATMKSNDLPINP